MIVQGLVETIRRRRRGISLLEVLISMFVLSIGLLGVASLMPIGKFAVREATKANQSAAAARAALRQLKVRRMLRPDRWLNYQGLRYEPTTMTNPGAWPDPDDPTAMSVTLSNPLDGGNSVCIDPMFIAANQLIFTAPSPLDQLGVFLFKLDNDPDPTATLPAPRMTRLTLEDLPAPSPPSALLTVADRIFTWQADVVFSRPDDKTLRPEAMLLKDVTSGSAVRGQFAGEYSWIATITPAVGEGSLLNLSDRRYYDVSVVVFFQRDLQAPDKDVNNRSGLPPSERMVYADFLNNSGLGGGDVRLRNPMLPTNSTDPDQSDFPEVRPGQWIMLSGWVADVVNTEYVDPNTSPPADPPVNLGKRAVFKWYRVVSADDLVFEENQFGTSGNPEWYQDVTLAGPDWKVELDSSNPNGGTLDPDATTILPTAYATLVRGVVGVYTKTMMIDSWSNR